jgi:hypothetical protein
MERQTLNELVDEIAQEFPDFELIPKADSRFMKVLDVLLRIITFNQMKAFMSGFITTIGEKVYTSSKWDENSEVSRVLTLRHERVHMRQKKKYTFVLFAFLYLFFPFPIGVAYFRKKFEMEAYEESIRSLAFYYSIDVVKAAKTKERFVSHFTTAQYFWMWPFRSSVERWYDGVVKEL